MEGSIPVPQVPAHVGIIVPELAEFLDVQRWRKLRPKTLEAYSGFLTRFFSAVGKPVAEIDHRDIRRFLMGEERERGNCARSISTKMGYVSAFFRWAVLEELIPKNPVDRLQRPKLAKLVPKPLSAEELELVREACETLRERCIIETLFGSGPRVSELVALDWPDVQYAERRIHIRDGKGGKERFVPASTRSLLLLRRMQMERTDGEPYVFRSRNRCRISTERVEGIVKAIGRRAGTEKPLTPHRLRHTLGCRLTDAGADPEDVRQILGHEDLRSVLIYSRRQRVNVEHAYRQAIA